MKFAEFCAGGNRNKSKAPVWGLHTREHPIKGNGAVDILAERPGERVVIEVETGKSDIKANIAKIKDANFDRVVLLATSPAAINACQSSIDAMENIDPAMAELLTWLDIS